MLCWQRSTADTQWPCRVDSRLKKITRVSDNQVLNKESEGADVSRRASLSLLAVAARSPELHFWGMSAYVILHTAVSFLLPDETGTVLKKLCQLYQRLALNQHSDAH